MTEQSYFGDVMKKLQEMAAKELIPIDETFKARLREELEAQESRVTRAYDDSIEKIRPQDIIEEPYIPSKIAREKSAQENEVSDFVQKVVDFGEFMGEAFQKWQGFIIGLPALLLTLVVLALVASPNAAEFEKKNNIAFEGLFTEEERVDEFHPILKQIIGRRDSEGVRVLKGGEGRVYIEVRIMDNGREYFMIKKERDKWFGRVWELQRARS